jgi:hypothetical protein
MSRFTVLAVVMAVVAGVLGLPGTVPPAWGGPTDPGGTFTDDNGSVHEGAIEAVAAEGITRGCNPPANDRFCPDQPVTRGQMAAFLVRAFDYSDGAGSNAFTDDNGSVFEDDIDRLAASAVTRGCNPPANDRFCPDQPVTRGQMAAFLVRAFDYSEGAGSNAFTDDNGSVFEDDIDRLAASAVTRGCNPPANDRFCPDQAITRAEMATFLMRALGLTPIVPPPPELPQAGNPSGDAPIPAEAAAVDTSNPDRVVGTGTPASCTSAAVVAAVAQGGIITFDCGPDPVTIEMTATAKVFNDRDPDVVIDGGGLVTLSGGGDTRILYMNTCDPAQVWTTPHCDDQDHPRLTVQNLTFQDGWVDGENLEAGGSAIYSRGGRLKIVNSRFFSNRCQTTGPDVGGAVRVFDQYQDQTVYVVNSTFGGSAELGNQCSNGAALSSIGVSWTVINSLFTHNDAVGFGANPAQPGTPGGGNGGAIALDGNTFTLTVIDSIISDNHANEGGGGIFFVSNDRSGTLRIEDSIMQRNPSDGFETIPGIFYLGNGPIQIVDSTIE